MSPCLSSLRYGARELASLVWQSAMQVRVAVEALEKRVNGGAAYGPALHAPEVECIAKGEAITQDTSTLENPAILEQLAEKL